MSLLERARAQKDIAELFSTFCDLMLLDEFCEPQNEGGHLTYSIDGQTFARAGDGSEYILLADGSVGYWGCNGQSGRLADGVEDFFEFVVNCPTWSYYAQMYLADKPPMQYYQDATTLSDFAVALMRYEENSYYNLTGRTLVESKQTLASALGIKLYENVSYPVLMKFFKSTTRMPRLITTYTETDGSSHSTSGILIQDEMEEDKGTVHLEDKGTVHLNPLQE